MFSFFDYRVKYIKTGFFGTIFIIQSYTSLAKCLSTAVTSVVGNSGTQHEIGRQAKDTLLISTVEAENSICIKIMFHFVDMIFNMPQFTLRFTELCILLKIVLKNSYCDANTYAYSIFMVIF